MHCDAHRPRRSAYFTTRFSRITCTSSWRPIRILRWSAGSRDSRSGSPRQSIECWAVAVPYGATDTMFARSRARARYATRWFMFWRIGESTDQPCPGAIPTRRRHGSTDGAMWRQPHAGRCRSRAPGPGSPVSAGNGLDASASRKRPQEPDDAAESRITSSSNRDPTSRNAAAPRTGGDVIERPPRAPQTSLGPHCRAPPQLNTGHEPVARHRGCC